MSMASEAAGMPNQLQTALAQGLGNLSREQSVIFTQYMKQTISADGYVFWAATATTLLVSGSLHYGTERDQAEDQTIGVNSVIFTAEQEVAALNVIGSGTIWIADWPTPDGGTLKIAFSSRGAYYEQAGLFHYAGFAVYPALQSQLITTLADLPTGPIVSNSLPIFLALASMLPTIPQSQAPALTLYPSFLVPENIVPPYGVVHIEPGLTTALQAFPHYQWSQKVGTGPYQLPNTQLMRDRVRITIYGMNNQQVLQWLSALILYSEYTDQFGFMSSPAVQDEKRLQTEIAALAMKKSISMDVSYQQSTADAIVRQLILSASISYTTEAA